MARGGQSPIGRHAPRPAVGLFQGSRRAVSGEDSSSPKHVCPCSFLTTARRSRGLVSTFNFLFSAFEISAFQHFSISAFSEWVAQATRLSWRATRPAHSNSHGRATSLRARRPTYFRVSAFQPFPLSVFPLFPFPPPRFLRTLPRLRGKWDIQNHRTGQRAVLTRTGISPATSRFPTLPDMNTASSHRRRSCCSPRQTAKGGSVSKILEG